MMPTLETDRLFLRPLELADAGQVQRIFPQWEVVKFLAARVPWPYPQDGVLTYYRDAALPAMLRGDEWHWTLRLKSAPEVVIGSIALHRGEDLNRGLWLGLPWQGMGLMSEAIVPVTYFWFQDLGFSVLRISKACANTASRRLSEKQGMRVVETTEKDYVGGRLATEIWELTAQEWRRQRGFAVS